MELGLNHKSAFIAGSSHGIGLAIARAFAQEGSQVVITGRDPLSLSRAKAHLEAEAPKNKILSICGDMTDPAQISTALEQVASSFGGVDAIVANIGSGKGSGGWEIASEEWESLLKANLVGGMSLASLALPHLITRGGGSITFISSIAGLEAIEAPLAYSAAKAGLLSVTKRLARMAGAHKVRVNAVAPGNVLFPGGRWESKLAERRDFYEQYVKSEVPLGRFGSPEEIASAVVFLASERASFITGSCLVVDGGQTRSY